MNAYRLSGSYTVEMTAVMGIVILVLSIMIQTGLRLSSQQTGIFNLQTMVERAGYSGEDYRDLLARSSYQIKIKKEGHTIEGRVEGSGWNLEIQRTSFQPEEWMRKLVLMENWENIWKFTTEER